MSVPAHLFDARLAAFKENQETPWGRLRSTISFANLQRHLEGESLHILDAGGGNGLDAVPLALAGHSVTLLDLSPEMLAEARRNAEGQGILDRIAFCQADVVAIPTLFPQPEFDAVLCHNVLPYVDDAAAVLEAACHALRPGGLLSVMCLNRYSETYRQALQQVDLAAAQAALGARSVFSAVFDTAIRVYAAEDILPTLEKLGCSPLGRYGVRCVCDYIRDNDIKWEPTFFAKLERLEHVISDRYPYYLLARFFQIVARKVVGADLSFRSANSQEQ